MLLTALMSKKWKVLAPTDPSVGGNVPHIPLLAELQELNAQNHSVAVAGLVRILEIFAEKGPKEVPPGWFHEADKKRKYSSFQKMIFDYFFSS